MSNLWWPTLSKDVAQFVRSCAKCQKKVSHRVADRVPLKPIRLIGLPLEEWQIDSLGPELPRTHSGKRCCLTMVCRASRWISTISLPSLKPKAITDGLMQQLTQTGLPKRVYMDQYSAHKSQLVTAFAKVLGIEVQFSTPYHKTGMGFVNARMDWWGGG